MPSLRKTEICARYVLRNMRAFACHALGLRQGESGTTHARFSVEESVGYIRRVFDDYLRYGGVSKDWLHGKRILEIGPGDNLGVALLWSASGAARVVCLDRFETRAEARQLKRIYGALRSTLADEEQQRFDEAIDRDSLRLNREKVNTSIGTAVEKADTVLEAGSFDWIVSRAVLEEVSYAKLPASLEALDRLLAPGGRMAHKIDLRDYGIFSGTRSGSSSTFHPLEYWTLSPTLHRLMSSHEPAPNRVRASAYRELLERRGYRCEMYITHLVGRDDGLDPHPKEVPDGLDAERAQGLVAEIRSRLAAPFRKLSDEDLMTTGIFLTAEKPRCP